MRFMLIVKASKESEAGVLPTGKELADMGKFNEQMVKNGMMLAGEGLQAELEGRPHHVQGRQADRRGRAVRGNQGARRRLLAHPGEVEGRGRRVGAPRAVRRRPIEVRQVFELEDFGQNEGVEIHKQIRDELSKK